MTKTLLQELSHILYWNLPNMNPSEVEVSAEIRRGEWCAAESTTTVVGQMNANPHQVFWFSSCLGPFVNLNELNPTEFSARLLK